MIIKPTDLLIEMGKLHGKRFTKGFSTGWDSLDEHFTVRPGEFTVVTGMPSHGKSEWLDALCANLVQLHNFRIPIFSPENHPLEQHLSKILEKFVLKPFYGNEQERMSYDEMLAAMERINKNFGFIKTKETEFTPKHIADEAAPFLDATIAMPKAMIIDPWNEMDHYRPSMLTETEYVSRTLTELRRFAREFKTHLFLVAHPTKMQKESGGNYPVPRPYDISGSAHWYNKADNCIAVWRDVMNAPDLTQIHVQKVRFKATGKPGMIELNYNRLTSTYSQSYQMPKITPIRGYRNDL